MQTQIIPIKRLYLKICAQFTSCISRINNMQIDDAQYIDLVMPMYNLIEYIDNYSKTSGISFHYCRVVPAADNNGAVTDFTEANVNDSFNFKEKLMVPLKYLSHFLKNS